VESAQELYDSVKGMSGNQLGDLQAMKFVQLLALCGVLPGDCVQFARPNGKGCKKFLDKHYPSLSTADAFNKFKKDLIACGDARCEVYDSTVEVKCCEANRRSEDKGKLDLFFFDKDRDHLSLIHI